MSALPTMSLRADPAHHALIRGVARALRDNPAMEAAIRDVLRSNTPPPPDDVVRRVTALEADHAALVTRVAELEAGRKRKVVPCEIATPDATRRIAESDPRQTNLEDFTGPPEPRPTFPAALKHEIDAAGMTPPEVARTLSEAGHPVSAQTVRNWIAGKGIKPEGRAALATLFPNLRGGE